jgi:GST-like protein
MHVLYGAKGSGSAAVEAALHWAGLPYRQVEVASWIEGSPMDALRALNPLAQVPTLDFGDGTVMSESAAILIELGLRHPHAALLPEPPAARAQALRALVYVAANCYAAIGLFDYPERFCAGPGVDQRDDPVRARLKEGARARLHQYWDGFAALFVDADAAARGDAAGGFLGGVAQPGAADLLCAVVSRWCGARAHIGARHPALAAMLARIDRHPRLAPVFERHWPAESA